MKFGALLIGLFVLFLSVKSVVEPLALLSQVDACCKKDKSEQAAHQEEPAEDSCDDLCSPFQPCCPYVAFSANFSGISIPKDYPMIIGKFTLDQVSFHSSYSADFWQPPKLA